MIGKCANPACRARFDHRVGGKFFRFHLPESVEFDSRSGFEVQTHNTHNVVHYWLCPICSKMFSLTCNDDGRVILRLAEQEFATQPAPHELTAA